MSPTKQELMDCIINLMAAFDNPIARRQTSNDFANQARLEARKILEHKNDPEFQSTIDCDTCGKTISQKQIYVDTHQNTVCYKCWNRDRLDNPSSVVKNSMSGSFSELSLHLDRSAQS